MKLTDTYMITLLDQEENLTHKECKYADEAGQNLMYY